MRPAIFDSNVRDGAILIEISNMKNEKYQSFKVSTINDLFCQKLVLENQ